MAVRLDWRRLGKDRRAHCFGKPLGATVWHALCGAGTVITLGGQHTERPIPEKRCGRCGGLEMEFRGAGESLPGSKAR